MRRPPHPWPCRSDLRARLIEAGESYLRADLLAVLTQYDRPDLRSVVVSILGGQP